MSGSAVETRGTPAPESHQEVEWQFEARDLGPVLAWLESGGFGGPRPMRVGRVEISDTYLDTRDLRVMKAGYALRIRRTGEGSETTLKSISSSGDASDALKRRREISEPGSLLSGAGPVARRFGALAGRRKPTVLFEVVTSRETFHVCPEEEGGPFAEIALDETEIRANGGETVSLRRVEVEVERGSAVEFEPFVERLRQGCGLSRALSSKFEVGLAAARVEIPEPPDLGPKTLASHMTLGEAAYAVLREQFEALLAHEMGVRIGEDPEELHDMRVAGRRSRAALKVFEEALPKRAAEFRREIGWISRLFGEVRDFDVQLQDLELRGPGCAELRARFEEGREQARREMLRALDSRRYRDFVEEYRAFLERGPSRRRPESARPVLEAAPEILKRCHRELRKTGDGISPSSPVEDYHKLRKRGKRLRYTLEFFAGIYGDSAKKEIRALKRLQDVLGEHQDAVVAAARLGELARSREISRETVFSMGGLARDYETRAGGLRGRFPKAYSKATGKRWKRLKKAIRRAGNE